MDARGHQAASYVASKRPKPVTIALSWLKAPAVSYGIGSALVHLQYGMVLAIY